MAKKELVRKTLKAMSPAASFKRGMRWAVFPLGREATKGALTVVGAGALSGQADRLADRSEARQNPRAKKPRVSRLPRPWVKVDFAGGGTKWTYGKQPEFGWVSTIYAPEPGDMTYTLWPTSSRRHGAYSTLSKAIEAEGKRRRYEAAPWWKRKAHDIGLTHINSKRKNSAIDATSRKTLAIRERAGADIERCPMCTRSASAPYRRVVDGRIAEGCIDATHSGRLPSISGTAQWHDRPEAKALRKRELEALMRKNPSPEVELIDDKIRFVRTVSRKNPSGKLISVLGHVVHVATVRGKRKYHLQQYGLEFGTKAGLARWLEKHVEAEHEMLYGSTKRKNPRPITFEEIAINCAEHSRNREIAEAEYRRITGASKAWAKAAIRATGITFRGRTHISKTR